MVKKIIIWIISLVILVALSVWGFMYYKRVQSFAIKVPGQADRVLRLDIEQMGKKLISTDMSGKKSGKAPKYGIDIPFNLFAFGIKGLPEQYLFSRLDISNAKDFEAWLSRDFKAVEPQLFLHKSGMFSCMHNKKQVVFILGKDLTTTILAAAQQFLEDKEVIPFKESPLYKIREAHSDVAMEGSWGTGSLSFEQGKINASLSRKGAQKATEGKLMVPENAALAVLSSENPGSFLRKLGVEKIKDSMPVEKLEHCFQDEFALFIDGEIAQNEVVVTYEFDDNFEKVPVSQTISKQVPNMFFYAYLKAPEQLKVLQEHQLLYGTDSFNKTLFPLFDLKYGLSEANLFSLYSGERAVVDSAAADLTKRSAPLVFKAWCQVDQLAKMAVFKEFSAYLKPFKKLSITGVSKDADQTTYIAELTFTNTEKSSLKQLLDLF